VLTRLDRRRRSHPRVVALFDRCSRGELALSLSTVNLAEVLEHGRSYSDATGLDLVAMVTGYRIELVAPDAETARVAARFAGLPDLSLGDRFAAATARVLGARLHTTDPALLHAFRRGPVPVTGY
jgi:predicted nucleic acid-binding protein